MKKIIIFSTAYLPMIGGAELAVKEITDRLPDCDFYLICARLKRDLEPAMRLLPSTVKKQEKIGRVNVYRIGFGSKIDKLLLPLFGFLKARQLYKKHLSLNSDHPSTSLGTGLSLILWGLMASWGSLAAWLFKIFYPGVPFLLTLQEGDSEKYIRSGRGSLINLGWRLIFKKADRVQAISTYLAGMARKYGYRGEIDVVPNGVDLMKYELRSTNRTSSSQARDELRRKLDIDDGEKIVITVSRLVEKNGIEDLIEGFSKLKTNQLKTKLLIVGSGPLEKDLKLEVKNLGLGDKVIFLGDISNEEVPKYLAIADVFARPSLSEGLGTAFLEAMAVGVPVVATSVGGIPDFLWDPSAGSGQVTGLFCEVKNPGSIAERINLLLTDENLRQKIIANARKLVEDKYSWDVITLKMAQIFDKIA